MDGLEAHEEEEEEDGEEEEEGGRDPMTGCPGGGSVLFPPRQLTTPLSW